VTNPYEDIPLHKPFAEPNNNLMGWRTTNSVKRAISERCKEENVTYSDWNRRLVEAELEGKSVFTGASGAEASENVKYRVVNLDSVDDTEEFENLLNEMASQGWTLDHVEKGEMAVFRR